MPETSGYEKNLPGANFLQDPLQTQQLIQRDAVRPFHLPPAARGCDNRIPPENKFALADVLRFILCHNPDTRESWANVLASAAALGAARGEYLPNVSGSFAVERSRFSPEEGEGTSTTSERHGVALDYLLFDFGGREARTESTKQDLLAANYAHDATLRNVVFQGIAAYYNLLSARASAAAARETERANYAGYEAARLRYEVGAAAIADQLQAETAYAQARLDRERAENLMKQREGELATLMGLAPNAGFAVEDRDYTAIEDGLMADVSPLLDKALAARPEIAAATARVKGAEASVDAAWAAHWPSIRAGVSQDYGNTLSGPGGDNDSTRFGVSVSIPLFSGFSTSYRVRQAQQQFAAESARKYALEQDVLLEVWSRYQDYGTARQNLDTTATLLTSAQQSYEVALGRYRAGAGSILDLLNAQAQLADARQQRVAAQYNWLISRTELVRAAGNVNWLTVTETPVAAN